MISPAGKEILGNETRAGQVRLATSGSFSSSYNLIKLAYLLLIVFTYLYIYMWCSPSALIVEFLDVPLFVLYLDRGRDQHRPGEHEVRGPGPCSGSSILLLED